VNLNKGKGVLNPGESYARQCVDFVRGMILALPVSGNWRKSTSADSNAWETMPKGTVIATFSGAAYDGHVAIFDKFENNEVWVFDQNFSNTPTEYANTKFRYHKLTIGATNYFAINNPNATPETTPNYKFPFLRDRRESWKRSRMKSGRVRSSRRRR